MYQSINSIRFLYHFLKVKKKFLYFLNSEIPKFSPSFFFFKEVAILMIINIYNLTNSTMLDYPRVLSLVQQMGTDQVKSAE